MANLRPLKTIKAWWWKITHPPLKLPKVSDLLIDHVEALINYYGNIRGEAKALHIRNRYRQSIAYRKAKIAELGFKPPATLEEAQTLRGYLVGGNRYGE